MSIEKILEGIDKTEVESTVGWWETSTGAEFGAAKLKAITKHITAPTDSGIPELDELCRQYNEGPADLSWLVCRIWNHQQGIIHILDKKFPDCSSCGAPHGSEHKPECAWDGY